MTKLSFITFMVLCFLMPKPSAYASSVWQCFAFNPRHQSYDGWSSKKQEAKKIAKKNCLRANKRHTLCTTADSFCYNLNVTTSEQECIVVDKRGKTFLSPFCKDAVMKCEIWQYLYGMPTRGGCIAKYRRQ